MSGVVSTKDERCMRVYIGWATKFCVQVERFFCFFFILQYEREREVYVSIIKVVAVVVGTPKW